MVVQDQRARIKNLVVWTLLHLWNANELSIFLTRFSYLWTPFPPRQFLGNLPISQWHLLFRKPMSFDCNTIRWSRLLHHRNIIQKSFQRDSFHDCTFFGKCLPERECKGTSWFLKHGSYPSLYSPRTIDANYFFRYRVAQIVAFENIVLGMHYSDDDDSVNDHLPGKDFGRTANGFSSLPIPSIRLWRRTSKLYSSNENVMEDR